MIELFLYHISEDQGSDWGSSYLDVVDDGERMLSSKIIQWFTDNEIEYYYALSLVMRPNAAKLNGKFSNYYIGGFLIYINLSDAILFKLSFPDAVVKLNEI